MARTADQRELAVARAIDEAEEKWGAVDRRAVAQRLIIAMSEAMAASKDGDAEEYEEAAARRLVKALRME